MKKDWSHLEGCRVRKAGIMISNPGDPFGIFRYLLPTGVMLSIIASSGAIEESDAPEHSWEHVSVAAYQPKLDGSTEVRVPTWDEMCIVKSLFWDASECVMQLHPPESSYVNIHPNVLHLWRPLKAEIPQPPTICV